MSQWILNDISQEDVRDCVVKMMDAIILEGLTEVINRLSSITLVSRCMYDF